LEEEDNVEGCGGGDAFGVADLGGVEREGEGETEPSFASTFVLEFPFEGGDGFLRMGLGTKLGAERRLGEVYTSMLRSSSSESVSRSIVLLLNRTTG